MRKLLALALMGAVTAQAAEYQYGMQQICPDCDGTYLARLITDGAIGQGLQTFSVADGSLLRVDFFWTPEAPQSPGIYGGLMQVDPAAVLLSESPAVATFQDGVLVDLQYHLLYADSVYAFDAGGGHFYQSGKGWGQEWVLAPAPGTKTILAVPEPSTWVLLLAGLAFTALSRSPQRRAPTLRG